MGTMSTQPLFSILIANYNNGGYLAACIQSILTQTYTHWEVVIVDDGSTDKSRAVYEKYTDDIRFFIFYNEKNKGCGFTKNRCITLAHGQICAFLDPDDTITSDALEVMVQAHHQHPEASLIYSTHYICNENLETISTAEYVGQIPPGKKSWELRLPTISHFATFRRDRFLQTTGIYTWLTKAVDKDLYYKLETTGPVVYLDRPLYLYRHHGGSISLNKRSSFASMMQIALKTLMLTDREGAIQSHKTLPDSPMELAGALMLTGIYLIFHKNPKSGLLLAIKALKYKPLLAIFGPFWQIGRYFLQHI